MCQGGLYFHDCAPYKVFIYLLVYTPAKVHITIHPSVSLSVYYLPTYLPTDKVILSSSYAQVDSYHEYM